MEVPPPYVVGWANIITQERCTPCFRVKRGDSVIETNFGSALLFRQIREQRLEQRHTVRGPKPTVAMRRAYV